jgi:hypothetical protein
MRKADVSNRDGRIEQMRKALLRRNLVWARGILGSPLDASVEASLKRLTREFGFSVNSGDLHIIEHNWYVTHTGLIGLARRKKCRGIHVESVNSLCDPASNRFVMKATVYPSKSSSGFVGYGDADPSNVSLLVHGAEMRVAETRAVNRALRKAYGIGICSVEEFGVLDRELRSAPTSKKLPQPSLDRSGSHNPSVRDRLCQVIRQHELDANLVKPYAADFCGVKALRAASREQVENFVQHLADWAAKDRNALLCQLNSYMPTKDGAA